MIPYRISERYNLPNVLHSSIKNYQSEGRELYLKTIDDGVTRNMLCLLKREELPYRRLGGTRDGVIVIMERACARGGETYAKACNVAACIRSFTCNHEGASRRRRELRAALIVAPVMSKAKPILFALDSRQRFDVRHDRVIKLRYSRRAGIMSDGYRSEDAIRHHLPRVTFFQRRNGEINLRVALIRSPRVISVKREGEGYIYIYI